MVLRKVCKYGTIEIDLIHPSLYKCVRCDLHDSCQTSIFPHFAEHFMVCQYIWSGIFSTLVTLFSRKTFNCTNQARWGINLFQQLFKNVGYGGLSIGPTDTNDKEL